MEAKLLKSFHYQVKKETLSELKQKFNADIIVRNNPDLNLYSGEWVKIIVNDYKTHIVLPTQTLEDVCKKYNIEKEKLIKDNNLSLTKLFIGQHLKIFLK